MKDWRSDVGELSGNYKYCRLPILTATKANSVDEGGFLCQSVGLSLYHLSV